MLWKTINHNQQAIVKYWNTPISLQQSIPRYKKYHFIINSIWQRQYLLVRCRQRDSTALSWPYNLSGTVGQLQEDVWSRWQGSARKGHGPPGVFPTARWGQVFRSWCKHITAGTPLPSTAPWSTTRLSADWPWSQVCGRFYPISNHNCHGGRQIGTDRMCKPYPPSESGGDLPPTHAGILLSRVGLLVPWSRSVHVEESLSGRQIKQSEIQFLLQTPLRSAARTITNRWVTSTTDAL